MWTHCTENVWNSSHHTLRSLWHHLVVKLDYHWSFHLMKRTGLLVGITCSRVGHVTVPPNNLFFRCNFISDTWIRIDTWPWWFNSFKSQWNTVGYISKTNNIQTRQTIRLLQNRIFYRIWEILEEDGSNGFEPRPWSSKHKRISLKEHEFQVDLHILNIIQRNSACINVWLIGSRLNAIARRFYFHKIEMNRCASNRALSFRSFENHIRSI